MCTVSANTSSLKCTVLKFCDAGKYVGGVSGLELQVVVNHVPQRIP